MQSSSIFQPITRIILYGFLVWLVPFLAAMAFFTPEGELSIDIFLFKTIMLLISTPLGLFLMAVHLRRCPDRYLQRGLFAGIVWILINWGLDFAILLQLSGQSPGEYFVQIGLRYFAMIFSGLFMGYAIDGVLTAKSTPER